MFKSIIVLSTFVITSNFSFSQGDIKVFGDVKLGAGIDYQGSVLPNVGLGVNSILSNNMYIGLSGSLGFGGKLTNPNSTVGYSSYSALVGYSNEISDKFRIIPYAGVNYQSFLRTTRTREVIVDDLNAIAGQVGLSVKDRYETENIKGLGLPIGVDFHLHNEKIGFVVGYYFVVSQYAETGLKLGFTFGKQ